MPDKLTCYVIGENSLSIKCCEILLNRGHLVYGIASSNPTIRNWAIANKIEALELNNDLTSCLRSKPYDYLFSIVNLSILPDEVINSPRKCAINFHDGPLPKYAGINATSWAIINQEKAYGITWHKITNDVDAGDILKQVVFEIENETALSLNVKCFEKGLSSFGDLVDELANGTNNPIKQNFNERTYFGKYKRPDNAAIIDWHRSAEEISALVRGLDFGGYTNPFGLPKVKAGNENFNIREILVTDKKSIDSPGMIVSISDEYIRVATRTNEIEFREGSSIDGMPLSISKLVERYSLKLGYELNELDIDSAKHITKLNSAIAKKEEYWVHQLSALEYANLNYAKKGISFEFRSDFKNECVNPTANALSFFDKPDLTAQILLASAFGIFIGRHCGISDFTVGYTHTALLESIGEHGNLFSEYVPLRIAFDSGASFASAISSLAKTFKTTTNNKTYLRDVWERYPALNRHIVACGASVSSVNIAYIEDVEAYEAQQGSIITFVVTSDLGSCSFFYDSSVIAEDDIKLLKAQFISFLEEVSANSEKEVASLSMLSVDDRKKLLEEWNKTEVEFPTTKCIHQLFEEQVVKTAGAIAVVYEGESLTYKRLNERSNQLAHRLQKLGIAPDKLVGVYLHRSLDMVVAIMGTLKAGGAYVPLDPSFPKHRISYMTKDSECSVIVTEKRLRDELDSVDAAVVTIDTEWNDISKEESGNPCCNVTSANLAYVIYTSGSTGRPKGVMVEHRNVVNFFTGMDACVRYDPGSTWLAVTSLSFDISVLEIFWTLARGFKVVIYAGVEGSQALAGGGNKDSSKTVDFSLFCFQAGKGEEAASKCRLLVEGARFADQNNFSGVWTLDDHLQESGREHPNSAVTSTAIAKITKSVQIRSGSGIVPLRSAVGAANELPMVDILSNGRVEEVRIQSLHGQDESVKIRSQPIQLHLPVWVHGDGNLETYQLAGAVGANLLVHLFDSSLTDVAERIAAYREAWKKARHPGRGRVALMLHTFVGASHEFVKETVQRPLTEYLRTSPILLKKYTQAVPMAESQEEVLEQAFDRFLETGGLFGTPESCMEMIERIKASDVDEVACLIDFGVSVDLVLDNLKYLNILRESFERCEETERSTHSIPELIRLHNVSHFQCTPSMASMLMLDEEAKSAFRNLKQLLIGGETFPVTLAAQLREVVNGDIVNMYGPTETTVWSTKYELNDAQPRIPIGRPIANTEIYILDENLHAVPIGVQGELVIGGAGVARGYLNRPELTAERFINNPFSDNPESHLYRTGDLARYLPDGNIDIMGRMDHQVKIMGYRIELGEIEVVLNKHPAVYESVVIAREDIPGQKRLVAYVIPRNGEILRTDDLSNYVKEKLPAYMVPVHFVTLKVFPQTPNKKIDRKALPAPEKSLVERGFGFDPPLTDIEEAIAGIWAEALGVRQVGRNENFFDMGGDSLSVVGIILSIQRTCNVDLPLQTIFRAPTVAALAKKLEEAFLRQAKSQNTIMASHEVFRQIQTNSIDFVALPPQEEDRTGLEDRFEPPCTPTEKVLAAIWTNTLRVDRVGRNDHFFHLGSKSLDAVNLFTKIEEVFGKRLPLSILLQAPTLKQLANVLDEDEWETNWLSLVTIEAGGTKPPLFLVHGAEGNVLFYRDLARYLGTDQPMYGLQSQGLDGSGRFLTQLDEMASHYVREIRCLQSKGPYYLGGYCLGGIIALEMAQQLRTQGEQVGLVAMMETYNVRVIPMTQTCLFSLFHLLQNVRYHLGNFLSIRASDRWKFLKEKCVVAKGRLRIRFATWVNTLKRAWASNEDHRYLHLTIKKVNEQAAHAYLPKAYSGRVVVFRPRVYFLGQNDPEFGWGGVVRSGLSVCQLPFYPRSMLVEPFVQTLAEELKACLEEARI